MELDLGLALRSNYNNISEVPGSVDHGSSTCSKKRGVGVAFEDGLILEDDVKVPTTLPLLLWDKQPNGDNDDDSHHNLHNHNFSFAFNRIGEEENDSPVGWPPIKVRSKRICSRWPEKSSTAENGCASCRARPSSGKYVKVKMEGVAITRKINLSLYHSLPSLKHALFSMFGFANNGIISRSYKLTYQDIEGNWLLAQDIIWRSFIDSAQRLRLIKRSS